MGLLSQKARQVRPKSPAVYVRHRPETTLLYQIVREYWPEFQVELTNHGKYLPAYVTDESDQTPAEKRASMTSFCSCKTGIHAIPGNNLGNAIEACFHQE